MSTTTEPITTEQVAAPTPQVVEAPAPVTEQEPVKSEEEAKTEEPTTTTTTADEVAATEVTEAAPTPTTSKSNPTNRLSLFLGKAKTFVDKKVHEKKPAVPKKDTTADEVVETEPTVSSPVTEEAPAEEPATREVETTKIPKSEKRKSILAGIFRSKSPVNKEVEKSEDAATEVAKPDETVANKEIQETPAAVAAASATGVVEEEPIVAEHAEKENVMDHIKRSPLGKLFKQKKEVEHKEEPVPATTPESEAPVIAEPDVVTEETPAVDVAEPAVEAPAQEKIARSGSPLGRRITQMFRGFSSKKKVPTVAEDATKKEETTREITTESAASETAAVEEAPAAAIEEAPAAAAKEEEEQQEKPAAEVTAPAQVPAVQPTA